MLVHDLMTNRGFGTVVVDHNVDITLTDTNAIRLKITTSDGMTPTVVFVFLQLLVTMLFRPLMVLLLSTIGTKTKQTSQQLMLMV